MNTILLADDNKNWLDILEEGIGRESQFQVVGRAYSGTQAIELIEQLRPDIIILDIIMPEYDGVYIANHVKQNLAGYSPIIYVLSGIATDTVVKIFNDLGIAFYSLKPVTLDIVIDTLKKISRYDGREQPEENTLSPWRSEDTMRDRAKKLIYSLGMHPHLLSSQCTLEAVCYYANAPDSGILLTKVLYPEIGQLLRISKSSVEKNIRISIAQMQKVRTSRYQEIFSYAKNFRISNGEFLSVIKDYV